MSEFTWTTDKAEARKEQAALRSLVTFDRDVVGRFKFENGLAVGTAYDESLKLAIAVCVPFDSGGRRAGDDVVASAEVDFPYVAGLLAFRVGPAICKALDQVIDDHDLLLFDGQGIAHPTGLGLASHIGVLYNKPSVGLTRNNLFGVSVEPPRGERNYTEILHPRASRVIGYTMSLGPTCAPIYSSPGHRLTPAEAVNVILQVTRKGSCFPSSLAAAHSAANRASRSHLEKT